jgi:Protein of unknown function (DUF1800)
MRQRRALARNTAQGAFWGVDKSCVDLLKPRHKPHKRRLRPRPLVRRHKRRKKRPRAPRGVHMSPVRVAGPRAPVFGSDLGNEHLKRLLWRAGFGPRTGDVDALRGKPLADVVHSLTRPDGAPVLTGPEPRDADGPIAPFDADGHDHLWWLDRMVRSDQQLVERMTLIWHDWFATSNAIVGSARLMIDQNELFRRNALGSFKDLLTEVTKDPAMLIWLNGVQNRKGAVNENYARELMELFTLGPDRGAYTETDVRQLALALTGWRANFVDGIGWSDFRYDEARHDHSTKTVFGKSGDFDWQGALDLVLANPFHASFFVTKLWSYFVPTPPDGATAQALESVYLDSGYGIRPVVEAILMHPDFYERGVMVKPPVVYAAGILRALGRGIDRGEWTVLCQRAGQRLFYPPDVSGWNYAAWLDTSTWLGRFQIPEYAFNPPGKSPTGSVYPWGGYNSSEDADNAVAAALAFLDNPALSAETRTVLTSFAANCLPSAMTNLERSVYRAMRQNALRQLIVTAPEYQTC